MNPLEDIIVALRPVKPDAPFTVPNSIRHWDPSMPSSATWRSFDPLTGAAVVWSNADLHNFGWEYMWHCHLLGHEENDMMRPIVFNLVAAAPVASTSVAGNNDITVTVSSPPTPGPVPDHYDITMTAPGPAPVSGQMLVLSTPTGSVTFTGITQTGIYSFTVQAVYVPTGTSMPTVVTANVP